MFRHSKFLGLATLGIAIPCLSLISCQSGRYSTAGFHLPPDGDAQRGKAAFVALGCHSCHEVAGVDLPRPTAYPTVPVVLGGEVDRRLSDAYLVTSMIDPSHQLAPCPAPCEKSQITVNGQSRMPSYVDRIDARQMIDIVAFLQSRYVIRRPDPRYTYPGMPG